MALQVVVRREGYTFTEDIAVMDQETIMKSRETFESFRKTGIIVAGEYDDRQWTVSNEVKKGASISFQVDEIHFINETAKKLGCTLSDYQKAMRVVVTSRFGYSVSTLQNDSVIMRNFADRLELPKDYANAQLIEDLLVLLPGDSIYRAEVLAEIDDIPRLQHMNRKQRRLAHYQSYLRFVSVFEQFWPKALPEEKVFFFPVWFWMNITGVLPLRPTECVLTPRNCIRREGPKYYLTVRRTRLKGTLRGSQYNIESDYERKEYPIPADLAEVILEYIAATEATYESDIDVLFCKASQFSSLDAFHNNDKHYTYANLNQCLSHFYRRVLQEKYGYHIVSDCDGLETGEIERIDLGDTRHIAMISLAITGGSPTICKELAGHDSIAISSHYYSNLTEFLDVLGYERFREQETNPTKAYGIAINRAYPVENGYCQNAEVIQGNYQACATVVDSYGKPGSCKVCRWYFPGKRQISFREPPRKLGGTIGTNSLKEAISVELQETCTLLRQAVEQVRQHLGSEDTVSSILDRLAAQARQYVQASAMERILAERKEW